MAITFIPVITLIIVDIVLSIIIVLKTYLHCKKSKFAKIKLKYKKAPKFKGVILKWVWGIFFMPWGDFNHLDFTIKYASWRNSYVSAQIDQIISILNRHRNLRIFKNHRLNYRSERTKGNRFAHFVRNYKVTPPQKMSEMPRKNWGKKTSPIPATATAFLRASGTNENVRQKTRL